MRLKDKIAVITGAGEGFGPAIAQGYHREGAKVYLHDFPDNAANLEKVAKEYEASTGVKPATGLYDIIATGRR